MTGELRGEGWRLGPRGERGAILEKCKNCCKGKIFGECSDSVPAGYETSDWDARGTGNFVDLFSYGWG
jgi:hypothetical protein